MIIQPIMLIIEIFSNHLIILKKQNILYRPLNWYQDWILQK
jgi:hypothetical protein